MKTLGYVFLHNWEVSANPLGPCMKILRENSKLHEKGFSLNNKDFKVAMKDPVVT